VIERLAAQAVPVIALAELPRRLEDVYLSIVESKNVDRGSWSAAGDLGLGTREWEKESPNPQSPIPNPKLEEVQQ
jgi:hypothetical protein